MDNSIKTQHFYFFLLSIVFFSCTDKRTVNEIIEKGKEDYNQGIYTYAREEFSKALNKDNKNSTAYYYRGLCEVKLSKNQEALLDFQRALENDSTNTQALVARAKLKISLGDFKSGIADCNKAIILKEDSPESYLTLGDAYEKINDKESAILNYEKAIDKGEKGGQTYYKLAILKLPNSDLACPLFSKAGELGFMDAFEMIKKYCNSISKEKKTAESNKKKQSKWISRTHGTLSYSHPKDWTELKYSVNNGNKNYGCQFFALDKTAQFSVIESANNTGENNAHNLSSEDIKTVVLGLFSPFSKFGRAENKKIALQNAKYIKAHAITSNGMSVSSINYIILYNNKTILIQGIYPSKDEIEFLPVLDNIIESININY